jgi:hypothetical protein
MTNKKTFSDSVRKSKSQFEALFAFLEGEDFQNAFVDWVEQKPNVELKDYLAARGVSSGAGISISSAIPECVNLCIGSWCPVHIHLPSLTIDVGRCEDE